MCISWFLVASTHFANSLLCKYCFQIVHEHFCQYFANSKCKLKPKKTMETKVAKKNAKQIKQIYVFQIFLLDSYFSNVDGFERKFAQTALEGPNPK